MASEYTQGMVGKTRAHAGSPPGLYRLCLAELWERAAYYGMRGLLVLFLMSTTRGGPGWATSDALSLYGTFTFLAYLLPIPGGFLADWWLGQRKAVIMGGALMLVGYLLLALPAGPALYLGLGVLILGGGFFKPSMTTLLGGLYPVEAGQRDGGFTLYYLGIHFGAMLGSFVCGTVGHFLGWHWGFGAAAAFMLLGLMTFLTVPARLLTPPKPASASLTAPPGGSGSVSPTHENRARTGIIAILGVFTFVFWTCYELSSLPINHASKLHWTLFGVEVPGNMFSNSGSWFMLPLAILLMVLWNALAARGRAPGSPVKMGAGALLMALGFAFMFGAWKEHQLAGQASAVWLLMTHLFLTLAELCTAPIALSEVTRLAPARFPSTTVGSWFLLAMAANWLASVLSDDSVGISTLLFTGAAAVAGGVLLIALAPALGRWLRNATTAPNPSPAALEPGPARPAP
ncbi:peptide MFS transporter [Pyxidicoccus caerfyrddinensis]|uniref:peptide MFS transporter n=1 Tax=Pyxidicoccus caerfyrddinensis TaxID=2709663 RepID=UPI0013DCBF2B|nr:peptide MFS transporter [Pyxidicoccus caerfyrddinensis]